MKINTIFEEVKSLAHVSILITGWNDGDYFLDLCIENSGIDDDVKDFYKSLPVSKKVTIAELYDVVQLMTHHPVLKSLRSEVEFHYDLHIWFKNKYCVYNFYHDKIIVKEINWIQRALKTSLSPHWQH